MAKIKKAATSEKNTDSQTSHQEENWLEIFSLFIHDIESPLASMKYILKLLDEGKLDSSKELHRRLISSSRISLERAESIIYDIMAVAKSGKAKLSVNLETVNAHDIIENAILLSLSSATENEINFSFEDNSGSTQVLADTKLLKRTIDNLLFNAIRHTPSGGEIKIYTETTEESHYIHIKDSGQGLEGISPDELFEQFGQTHMRLQGKHRGVGLGLYFCKIAATEMKGTILADDHPEGGAVFSIRLQRIKG